MVPDLIDGVLPEGVHDATMEEVEARFGAFRRTDRRVRLTERLRAFLAEAKAAGIAEAVILDGSYVSGRDEPDDIDLILVLRPGIDPASEFRPSQYNVLSRRVVKNLYKFDLITASEEEPLYAKYVDFFSNVRRGIPDPYTSRDRKGLLRILL